MIELRKLRGDWVVCNGSSPRGILERPHYFLRGALVVLVLLSIPCYGTHAENLETIREAQTAFDEARYSDVIALIGDECGQSNPQASVIIGRLYFAGLEVEQDRRVFEECFVHAADHGVPVALFLIAHGKVFPGQGAVPRPVGITLLEEAADQRHRLSQLYLGSFMYLGYLVERDEDGAMEIFSLVSHDYFTTEELQFFGGLDVRLARIFGTTSVGLLYDHMIDAGLPYEDFRKSFEDFMSASDWNELQAARRGNN